MGYLTGSQRRPGNKGYPRPGLTISGAISLAVDEINKYHPLRDNHTLTFTVAETYGEESESIYRTAVLWTQGAAVYVGPQETCVHEARMAASFDLPMISYCTSLKNRETVSHLLAFFDSSWSQNFLEFWSVKY
ncbi:unnamed protein product [Larinioides sclopetarius]|uniref:Receptor ligand binding region domain-containing protein n=1 Tax=Larinioides sclopetarius TaxID=280406 RepID=A0AAV2B5I5_9ARAC